MDEIGLYFESSGFIQAINLDRKTVVINFSTTEQILEDVVFLVDPKTQTSAKGIDQLSKLRVGMEVVVIGDKYPKQGTTVAKSITIKEDKRKVRIDKGRLDDVTKEFAVVDGYKVKLKPGEKIIGDRKSLYRNKIFNGFIDLKLGDFVKLEGIWDETGFVLASNVSTMPDLETIDDMKAKHVGEKTLYNFLVDDWLNPQKRKRFFGIPIDKSGMKIINSSILQNYIQDFGTRLVPEYVREKFRFIFIVVDTPEWNAGAQADGLVLVYRGLLDDMPNEAQLAAVLGHEITHTIYEHIANDAVNNKQLDNQTKSNQQFVGIGSNITQSFVDWAKLPPVARSAIPKYKLKQDVDSIAKALTTMQRAKRGHKQSTYNIDQESQSDRVGLYWMAKAGYDPREAMKVWRDMYNSYYHKPTEEERLYISKLGSFSKEFDQYRRPPSATDIGLYFFKKNLKDKATSLNKASFHSNGQLKDHPSDVSRFAALNKYTYLFYSNPSELVKYRLGEDELQKVKEAANSEMERAAKELAEKNARESAKRVAMDKARKKAEERIRGQLAGRQTVILSYKGFNLPKPIRLNEVAGKNKCSIPKLGNLWVDVHTEHNMQIETFVKNFKGGQIGPNVRDRDFAIYYSASRGFNDFTVSLAAAYQVCDNTYLNAVGAAIEKNVIKEYFWPENSVIVDMWEYLESLDKTTKNP